MFKEIQSISKILKDLNIDWYIAGGWAIDLYLGKKTREHLDIEIAITRTDQLVLKKYLNTPLHKVSNGKLDL